MAKFPYRMAARLDDETSVKLRRLADQHKGGISDVIRALVMAAPEDMIVAAQPMSNLDTKSLQAQRVEVAN